MIQNYFDYQRRLAEKVLLPSLRESGIDLTGKAVLDAGCGHGGVLSFLADQYKLKSGLGIDTDSVAVEGAEKRKHRVLNFQQQNFLTLEAQTFDMVILRDMLEHVREVDAAFLKASRLVGQGGYMYVSYAPFFSPFGGHQHNGSGIFARIPWLQILPGFLFKKMIGLKGNVYKDIGHLEEDIDSVLSTKLTMSKMRRLVRASKMELIYHKSYLIRPDYKIKFGLRPLRMPVSRLSFISEFLCTGEELILKNA
ncbi:class I SAM-dependent methyltransferase [Fibrobacterota bacterium]